MSLCRKPGVAKRTALTSSRSKACPILESATAVGIPSTAFFARAASASTTAETSALTIRLVRRAIWSAPIRPAPTTQTRRFVDIDSEFITGSTYILRLINRTGASKTAGGLSLPDIQDNSIKGLAEIRIPFLFRIAIKYKNIATSRGIQRTSENDTNNIQTGRLNPFLCGRIKRLCSEALDC